MSVPENYSAHFQTSSVNGSISVDFPVTFQGRLTKELALNLGTGGPTVKAMEWAGDVFYERIALRERRGGATTRRPRGEGADGVNRRLVHLFNHQQSLPSLPVSPSPASFVPVARPRSPSPPLPTFRFRASLFSFNFC